MIFVVLSLRNLATLRSSEAIAPAGEFGERRQVKRLCLTVSLVVGSWAESKSMGKEHYYGELKWNFSWVISCQKRGVFSTMKFSQWLFADSSKVQGVCHWRMFIYRCFCFGDCWHGISLRIWVDRGCTKSVTLLWSTACNFDVFEYDACFELGNCSQPCQCKLCRIYHVSPVTTTQWLVRFTEEILYMKNVGYVRYKDMCKK